MCYSYKPTRLFHDVLDNIFLLLESWHAEEERSSWPTGSRDMKPWFGNILMYFPSSSPSFLPFPSTPCAIFFHLLPFNSNHVFPSICKTRLTYNCAHLRSVKGSTGWYLVVLLLLLLCLNILKKLRFGQILP